MPHTIGNIKLGGVSGGFITVLIYLSTPALVSQLEIAPIASTINIAIIYGLKRLINYICITHNYFMNDFTFIFLFYYLSICLVYLHFG